MKPQQEKADTYAKVQRAKTHNIDWVSDRQTKKDSLARAGSEPQKKKKKAQRVRLKIRVTRELGKWRSDQLRRLGFGPDEHKLAVT